ncbi:anthranilate synthase family protein [Longispora urticae]
MIFDDVLTGDDPFVVLHRPGTRPDELELLTGDFASLDRLEDVPVTLGGEVLAIVPYRQITEHGHACRDDAEPILALTVRDRGVVALTEAVARIPDAPVTLEGADFEVSDEEYAAIVRTILADEIGHGEGANFVIKRSFAASVPNFSRHTALALYRRLLLAEVGSYWTFLVHTGDRTFIGATPERHVSLTDGTVVMNPISGTYRYPDQGPELGGVLGFLADRKEAEELFMVLDEELKMLARICAPGLTIRGPELREMARLAHTEYFIEGSTGLDARAILRETMFAPTVTGSPLESAFRVIARHEPTGRGYYSGVLALIGVDDAGRQTMDSAIVIRTADIDATGALRIGVGATLVRLSDPDSEVAETRAKVAGVLSAFSPTAGTSRSAYVPGSRRLGAHPRVLRALESRNVNLAQFWLRQGPPPDETLEALAGIRALVIDNEDRFTAMLGHQLGALGVRPDIRRYDTVTGFDGFDLVVFGPGPGDPNEHAHPKIATLRRLTQRALAEKIPFLSVCLGHQILSSVLGFDVVRRDTPNQGLQKEIDLFGDKELVGFYNSFTARSAWDAVRRVGLPGQIEISRDPDTGDVYALRAAEFASVQFHPESVLTRNGPAIVGHLLSHVWGGASADLALAS